MLPYIIDTCEFHNNVKTEIQKAAPNQISFANKNKNKTKSKAKNNY